MRQLVNIGIARGVVVWSVCYILLEERGLDPIVLTLINFSDQQHNKTLWYRKPPWEKDPVYKNIFVGKPLVGVLARRGLSSASLGKAPGAEGVGGAEDG